MWAPWSLGDLDPYSVVGSSRTVAGNKSVDAAQEALDTFHSFILPIEFAIRRGGEQRVHAGAVSTVALNHLIRGDDVTQTFGHLGSALDDHALRKQAFGGFVVLDQSHVAHEFSPEARVNEMQNGVFNPANILIDALISKPVAGLIAVERRLIILRVRITIEIPRRIDERVHRVSLTSRRAAAFWASGIDELRHLGQWRATGKGDVDVFRQDYRQVFFEHRDNAIPFAIQHGDGRAPIALTRNTPILKSIGYCGFTEVIFFGVLRHGFDRLLAIHATEAPRVHQRAFHGSEWKPRLNHSLFWVGGPRQDD